MIYQGRFVVLTNLCGINLCQDFLPCMQLASIYKIINLCYNFRVVTFCVIIIFVIIKSYQSVIFTTTKYFTFKQEKIS